LGNDERQIGGTSTSPVGSRNHPQCWGYG
jgi:putative transposase